MGSSGRPLALTLQCVQVHLNSVQSKDVGRFLASLIADAAKEYRDLAAAPQCQGYIGNMELVRNMNLVSADLLENAQRAAARGAAGKPYVQNTQATWA